jgi:hypothetical protein
VTDKEAMKLALDSLTYIYTETTADEDELIEKAITAIKEALAEHAMRETQRLGQEIEPKIGCVNHDCDQCKAQPEQEPVADDIASILACRDMLDAQPVPPKVNK